MRPCHAGLALALSLGVQSLPVTSQTRGPDKVDPVAARRIDTYLQAISDGAVLPWVPSASRPKPAGRSVDARTDPHTDPEGTLAAVRQRLPRETSAIRRHHLIRLIGELPPGTEGVDAYLVELIESSDTQTRLEALGAVHRRGVPLPPPPNPLLTALKHAARDTNALVRQVALGTFVRCGSPETPTILQEAFKHPDPATRMEAAIHLAPDRDPAVLTELEAQIHRVLNGWKVRSPDAVVEIDTEKLVKGLQTATGTNLAPLPLNPVLCSDLNEMAANAREYERILGLWRDWFAARRASTQPVR